MRQKKIVTRLSDAHYIALGKICAEWAFLEHQVHDTFGMVTGIEFRKARLIAAKIRRAEVLFDIMEPFVRDRLDESGADEFVAIRKAVLTLEKERDTYVHALWWRVFADDSIATGALRARAKPKEIGPILVGTIEDLAVKLNEAARDLILFVSRHQLPVTR